MAGFVAMLLNEKMLKSKLINMHQHIAPYLSTGNSLSLRWNIAHVHRDLGAAWCKRIVTVLYNFMSLILVFIVELCRLKNLVYFLFSGLSNTPWAMFSKSNKLSYHTHVPACASLTFSFYKQPVFWPGLTSVIFSLGCACFIGSQGNILLCLKWDI